MFFKTSSLAWLLLLSFVANHTIATNVGELLANRDLTLSSPEKRAAPAAAAPAAAAPAAAAPAAAAPGGVAQGGAAQQGAAAQQGVTTTSSSTILPGAATTTSGSSKPTTTPAAAAATTTSGSSKPTTTSPTSTTTPAAAATTTSGSSKPTTSGSSNPTTTSPTTTTTPAAAAATTTSGSSKPTTTSPTTTTTPAAAAAAATTDSDSSSSTTTKVSHQTTRPDPSTNKFTPPPKSPVTNLSMETLATLTEMADGKTNIYTTTREHTSNMWVTVTIDGTSTVIQTTFAQRFTKQYDKVASPKVGSVGLGSISGKIGVVKSQMRYTLSSNGVIPQFRDQSIFFSLVALVMWLL